MEFIMKFAKLTQVAAAALLASAGATAYAQMGGQQQPGGGGSGGQPGMQMPKDTGPGGGMMKQRPGAGGGQSDMERGQRSRGSEPRASEEKGRDRQQRAGERQPEGKRSTTERRQDGKDVDRRATEQRGKERQQQAKERPAGEAKKGAGGGVGVRPELSSEQRATIRQRLSSGPRLNNANVAIAVGSRLPRTVTLRAIPASVIEIAPQYRGYRYVVVGSRILIVDPDTFEIVFVLNV